MFSNVRVSTRLWIPVVILVANVIIVTILGANALWHNLMSERMSKVQAVTMVGVTALQHFHSLETSGVLTREQAQKAARDALRGLRYDQDENIFVYDQQGINLVHGKKPELEGKNLIGLKDPSGLPVIQRLIEIAGKGGGFLTYGWARVSGSEPIDKIAYSTLFSPWGWMIGTGVYIDDMVREFFQELALFGGTALVLVLLAGGMAVTVGRSITRPLGLITGRMEQLASGDLTVAIGDTARQDELGAMSRALEVFRRNAVERRQMEQQQAARDAALEAERHQAMLTVADHFESKVGGIIRTLGETAHAMQGSARGLEQAADEATGLCSSVNTASTEASSSVESVAGASEELTASIAEISRRLAEANAIASEAVTSADGANQMVSDLNTTASRISQVVEMITGIAEQTNLLALNATIEAARAGDAGKGFAVVANEVKQLASQTGHATGEITRQIDGIQQETREAVNAIADIAAIIRQIEQIAAGIAGAVEQQGAATGEISRNIHEASASTASVSREIGGVSRAVEVADSTAHVVTGSANQLAQMADQLQTEITTLLAQVRAPARPAAVAAGRGQA